ncbi:MAG: NAD-dependent epimerase/dehydratase family protein [Methylocella sp.]|jgi:nucleoside-diphosphate-sugar epimerase
MRLMLQHGHASDLVPERVVVIGAEGFVGAALVAQLAAAKISHLGLGRHEIDLLTTGAAELLAAQLRPGDVVVAAAARAPCRTMAMFIENMIIVKAIIDALVRVPVSHVINVSSDAVYGDEPAPLTEHAPTAPESLHGAMHLAREIAFRSEIPAPLAIVRPTLIYGASDPHNGYGPNRFRRQAARGEEILLFGEGEERRDHVLVDDVAALILRIALRRSTGTLNIATGETYSFRAIAEMVVAAARKPLAIKGSPRHGPMPHNGYRPFDPAASHAAFPNFRYVSLPAGIQRVQTEMEAARG